MSNIQENLKKILSAVWGRDVRQAIHDSIHDCYEDGKAGTTDLLARERLENLDNVKADKTALAQEKTERLAEIAVERNRINGLSKMAEGSTTGDAELQDIRVGANAVVYENAGSSVREQFKDVETIFANSVGYEQKTFSYTEGQFVSSAGWISTSAGFAYSEPIAVKTGQVILFKACGYETNVAMISIMKNLTEKQSVKVKCHDSSLTDYKYVVDEDCEIILSFNVNKPHILIIIDRLHERTETLENITENIANVTTETIFTDLEIIGEVENNKNAQCNDAGSAMSLSDGSDKYKCAIANVSNIDYIKVYGSIGNSKKYYCLAIFIGNNEFDVVKRVYDPESTTVHPTTMILKVPKTATKVYVNGIDLMPSITKLDSEMVSSSYSKSEMDEKLIKPQMVSDYLIDEKSVEIAESKYISSQGWAYEHDSFVYTHGIFVKKGDIIFVKAKGYLTNVSIISKDKDSSGRFTPLVVCDDSEYKWYSYKVEDDGVYVLCGNKNYNILMYVLKSIFESTEKMEYCDLSLFEKFGVIGDSYASGELYYGNNYHDKYNISWGQIMARKHGTTCTNYSSGGLSTRSWLTAEKGLNKLNSTDPDDIYYLALGINDVYHLGISYLGTVADIETKADTFYGNYARIIEAVKNHAPHAKIVMFTCASTSGEYPKFNNAIIELANHYGIPYIVQASDEFFDSDVYKNMSGGHPRAIAYSGMAMAFERLLNKCFIENHSYFDDTFMY